jgi:hypothetical protein
MLNTIIMEWKYISEIPGYEHFTNYQLSSNGDLFNTKKGIQMKWTYAPYGSTTLKQEGQKKGLQQHRSLAYLYIQNPDSKPCVDHINGNPSDNRIENLRWVTRSENNYNSITPSSNTTGHRNIIKSSKQNGKNHYWEIVIRHKGGRIYKIFKRDPNNEEVPEEVIAYRDKLLLELHGEFALRR